MNNPLPPDAIQNEIENFKQLFNDKTNKQVLCFILGIDVSSTLNDIHWNEIKRELETHFDVEIEEGFLLQGDEQKLRDTTWWTREKGDVTNYFWRRFKEYSSKDLPPDVIRTVDSDTDRIMNNLASPSVSNFSIYGMTVGHVQSGKTLNYSSLICKACDAGYKFIIVIAGGTNNLRNQTQVRVNEALIGIDNGKLVGVGKLGKNDRERRPSSLTTTLKDFNKRDADRSKQMINFDNVSVPVVMVIKKQKNTLDNVFDWLNDQYKGKISKHAMLMIDDESDYASINTKDENNVTAINSRIRKLIGLFDKSVYLAYTATPYANIFINHKTNNQELGKDLFPKDFIVALNAPSNYFGAKKNLPR